MSTSYALGDCKKFMLLLHIVNANIHDFMPDLKLVSSPIRR